jgi:alpha-tubulin suppressor-like RCC1 family protein
MAIVAIATLTYASGGASGANTITFTNVTNVSLGQIIAGTGVPTLTNTYVVGISGNTLTLSQNLSAAATGTYYTYATSATQTGTNVLLGKIAFTWKGTYAAGTTYARQDIAYYNGSSYISLVDNNTGNTPANLTAYWQLFTQGVSSISSNAGEVVYNNGSGLVALPAGTSGQVLTIGATGLPTWTTPDLRSATKVKALVSNGMGQNPDMYRHNYVIMTDNSVKAWGWNGNSCLGEGTTNNRSYPGRVAFPTSFPGALKVWGNFQYNGICLDTNGQLWIWGYNGEGQCATGGTSVVTVPINASANASNSIYGKVVVDVAIGVGTQNANTLTVLCSDGTVHATGYNGYGQIGDGSTTVKTNFVQNAVLSNVIKISATREAYQAVAAVTSSGTLYTWGYNGDGQLGNGNTTNSTIAASRSLGALSGKFIYDVNGGYMSFHSVGRSTTATATTTYASGGASGATTITMTSVTGVAANQIVTGTGIPALTAGNVTGGVFVPGIKPTRVVSIVGNVVTLSNALTAQASGTYSFYQAGAVAAWGSGNATYGCFGDGTFSDSSTPVQVFATDNNPVEEIYSPNYDYPVSFCRKADYTWYVAGAGNYGANLDPANNHRSSWVQIAPTGVTSTNYITKVVKAGTGSYNWMAALDKAGAVYTWGYNGNGALGIGNTTNQTSGTIVKPPINIRTVKDIQTHCHSSEQNLLMLMDDGQLWITGYAGSYSNSDDRSQAFYTPQPVIF